LELIPESESRRIKFKQFMMRRTGRSFKFFENNCGKFTRKLKRPIVVACFLWLIISIYYGGQIPRTGIDKNIFDEKEPIQ